ncbi:MAG: type VI secretion system lipoprotein TssJ [Gammaproteobacteria bacterium]|nr:type VI secretion system lipoprotein TssJ [Gammaproteobacteria bacterium]
MKYLHKLSLTLVIGCGLMGCQSNKSLIGGYLELDTDITIDFIVDADSNPDEAGAGSPLFVRMYELKSSKMLQKADFIDLFEQDKKTLGSDMIGDVHRFKRFKPGENRTESFVLNQKTQYVALYAEFLNFQESQYKLVVPVVINDVFRNSVVVRIAGNEMYLNDSGN